MTVAMTNAATNGVGASGLSEGDTNSSDALSCWGVWLGRRIETGWRLSEWDARLWLFTGDLSNPRTRAFGCRVPNCPIIVSCPGRLCHSCSRALAASGLDQEEFVATHVPRPSRRLVYTEPGLCTVGGRKGNPCQRLEKSRRLCTGHYNRWYKLVRQEKIANTDDELRLWAQTQDGFAAMAPCIVGGCDVARNAHAGLCTPHYQKWFSDPRRHRSDIEQWAGRQAPAMTGAQFSLAPLHPVVRLEVLYGLQTRDVMGANVCPTMMRSLVPHLVDYQSLAFLREGQFDLMGLPNRNAGFMLANVIGDLHRELDVFNGIDPTTRSVWDMRAVAMHAGHHAVVRAGGRVRRRGLVDFTVITQPWLCDLVMAWARTTTPRPAVLATMVRATRVASDALAARPSAGRDATALTFADMTAVANQFRTLMKGDGEPYADKQRAALSFQFLKLVDFGRKAGLLDHVPGEFARHPSHRITVVRSQDEEGGKALPESVIRQLDDNLRSLGAGVPYAGLPAPTVSRMFQTIYQLLRDTGRRPLEIAALDTDCLERVGDDHNLIWDNFKAKRMRRRLPIDAATVGIIRQWQHERRSLRTIAHSPDKLFPAPGAISTTTHILTTTVATVLREWVTAVPRIDSDAIGENGEPAPFDRLKIYPYAFRHTYAQRHADAGTPIDVLKELMDHREASTTMRYYSVTLARKRKAVTAVRGQVIDRFGTPAPMSSNGAYERRSVAVPFGGCIEPTNVKAGGHGCPIRFQCAGCGFYRPDPSFLPAIEQHIHALRTNREAASAMDTEDWVVRNLTDQTDAFKTIAATMRLMLAQLPAVERQDVEEASRILRRTRAGRTDLPHPTIPGAGLL